MVASRPRSYSQLNTHRWAIGLIVIITLWRIALATILPITQDEAYYVNWSWVLQWGYFDHPPGVALLSSTSLLAAGNVFAARLGTLIVATFTVIALWRLYWQLGLRDQSTAPGELTIAMLIVSATIPGALVGIITTPDTLLTLCWVLALHEAHAATCHTQQRWRWLIAGLFTGCGLLSKYIMVLIGPVLLVLILLIDRAALRTRWPYLGGFIAIMICLPHIVWNANHDWLTVRFQFGHGFSTDAGTMQLLAEQVLPAVVTTQPYSLAATPMSLLDRIASVASFISSQLGFFGAMLIAFTVGVGRLNSADAIQQMRHWWSTQFTAPARALLLTATGAPLLLFGSIASFSSVEANWAALFLITAAPIFAMALRRLSNWVMTTAAINLLLVSLYIGYAAIAWPPLPDQIKRGLRETHGFAELADSVAQQAQSIAVFADRYQLAAMLNFYQPQLQVNQWPGITRPSEYLRGFIVPLLPLTVLKQRGFWLVTSKITPATIPGFIPVQQQVFIDCAGQVVQRLDVTNSGETACQHPLHWWQLIQYQSIVVR
ncbi:ArnT family glycosyltransferase [Thiospirillum jenense]|nr:glycosyltransferase family 39 protein [Thiospirillum jenense]